MTKSLADYAKDNPRKNTNKCKICALEQVKEINGALNLGIPLITIREWLINEVGMRLENAPTVNSLHHHKGAGHHAKST